MERIQTLQERPSDLDGFVNFIKSYEQTMEKRKSLLSEVSTVDEMYSLLSAYEVKVPTDDEIKNDDLHDSVQCYGDSIESADLFIEENKNSMMGDLDKQVNTLNEELIEMLGALHSGRFLMPESDPAEIVAELEQINSRILEIQARLEVFRSYQKLFQVRIGCIQHLQGLICFALLNVDMQYPKMAVDDMSNFAMTEKEYNTRYGVWKALHDWITLTEAWQTGQFTKLNGPEIITKTEEYAKEAYRMGKANKEDTVVFRLKDSIDDFKKVLPLIEELANEALKGRHWAQIFGLLGQSFNSETQFSITELIEFGIESKMNEELEANFATLQIESAIFVRMLSVTASKEFSFEKTLDKMSAEWDGVEFVVLPYKDSGTYILGGVDDIQTILDDQVVKIQSMCASPFIKYFEGHAAYWKALMLNLQDLLDNWLECQATWQYLGPIFGSKDIMRQMPEEGEKFQIVDQTWRDIMKKTAGAPGCLDASKDAERLQKLKEANRLLEIINKGLASYLEVCI
eukprot:Gb_30436 [translate_table: standard]